MGRRVEGKTIWMSWPLQPITSITRCGIDADNTALETSYRRTPIDEYAPDSVTKRRGALR